MIAAQIQPKSVWYEHLCACGLDIGEVIWHKASGHSFVAESMMLAVQQAVSPHKAAASTGP